MTRGGRLATEWVWMNYPEPIALHDYRYLGEDFREREPIKRKKRPRSWDRPLYAFRGGLRGAGASSTDSKIAANIERGF